MVDVILRGGRICDGTGAPARTGDVAIERGRIAAVGRIEVSARRVIDVSGLIVAPGFVDVHTHYDAQVTWDRLCTPSCWHGVTSVVVGNCGFALAPCRPAERDRLFRMLEHVEGMPLESLRAGVVWEWESFPEYLLALRARPLGLNVGALLGHSAIRAYVMGEDAYSRAARDGEIEAMRGIVRAGMAAGAIGLATSRSPAHVGEAGRPVPSRLAGRDELRALALAMAESGRGVFEITPETFPLCDEELGWLQAIARETGRPVSFSAVLDVPGRSSVWDPLYQRLRAGLEDGAAVYPQVSCRPMRFDFDLEGGCASLDAMPCWSRWRAAPRRSEKLALLRDPEFRAAVRAGTVGRTSAPSASRWKDVVLEEARRPEHQGLLGRTLAEIAALRGGDVVDALLDVSAAEDIEARFSMVLLNYDEPSVAELLRRPESLIALSDAGAHVSVLCDAGYATYLLGHWVRELGALGWEEAVRRLTSMPAEVYGIEGRGVLAAGKVADITCFDPARVAALPPEKVRDFPAGAPRYLTRAEGVEYVFVAGETFLEHGEWTGAHPGVVLAS